jgi:hypothetical protein
MDPAQSLVFLLSMKPGITRPERRNTTRAALFLRPVGVIVLTVQAAGGDVRQDLEIRVDDEVAEPYPDDALGGMLTIDSPSGSHRLKLAEHASHPGRS